MNNKHIWRTFCLCLFLQANTGLPNAAAQPTVADSLKHAAASARTDTDKVNALVALADITPCSDTAARLAYAREALALAEKRKWPRGLANCYASLGQMDGQCTGNYARGIIYCRKAAAFAEQAGESITEANMIGVMAQCYERMSQYTLAMISYREAIALHLGPEVDVPTLVNMGALYSSLGDYANALQCYEDALHDIDSSTAASKKRDANDTVQMGVILINKGDIYLRMKQMEQAQASYSKAYEFSEGVKSNTLASYALVGIARTYAMKDDYSNAIAYYDRALANYRSAADKKNEALILDLLANVYLDKGEQGKAMTDADSALELAEKNNHPELLPENYKTLGLIYAKQPDSKKAIAMLQRSIELSKNSGELEIQKDAWNALSTVYEHAEQPGPALEAYRNYISIRDSLYSIDKANELTRIDMQTDNQRAKTADSVKNAGKMELARMRMQKQRVYTWTGFAGLAVALLLVFFIYRSYRYQKTAAIAIGKAKDEISEEKQKSEALLLNILPEDVAQELKKSGNVQPRQFDDVTVMFTDFVNFTVAGEQMSPADLVAELHTCFKQFDLIIGKYGIEKIKTVGDGYIAVSGMPIANEHHAENIINAALEICDFMNEHQRQFPGRTFGIRIGINSGPVIAGIVGVTKFAYDIWGDTVNVAARMEQNSEDGKINISGTTYTLVKDKFACTQRGMISVKHKGDMQMYFVERA